MKIRITTSVSHLTSQIGGHDQDAHITRPRRERIPVAFLCEYGVADPGDPVNESAQCSEGPMLVTQTPPPSLRPACTGHVRGPKGTDHRTCEFIHSMGRTVVESPTEHRHKASQPKVVIAKSMKRLSAPFPLRYRTVDLSR